jgi:hypothetical protein
MRVKIDVELYFLGALYELARNRLSVDQGPKGSNYYIQFSTGDSNAVLHGQVQAKLLQLGVNADDVFVRKGFSDNGAQQADVVPSQEKRAVSLSTISKCPGCC